MAEQILVPVALKCVDYWVEPTKRQVNYIVRFNKIAKDLKEETESLKLLQDRVQTSVQIAKRNAEEIEKDVLKWLKDVESITVEIQSLEDEIEANKSCINGWCPTWSSRYRLAKKLTKKTAAITELRNNGNFDSVSHPAPPPGIELLPSGDFEAFESTRSAFIQIMVDLKDVTTNIIGVYGMGGVGKTTLAKQVGKKAKELNLFDQVVMAVVSQNVEIKQIQGQIADMLGLKFEQETEIGRAGLLCQRLKNERKILIILDDVWEYLDLGEIGIPFGGDHEGCKIVLTSRRKQVFNSMGIQRKVRLNTISEQEAYALFKKNAGLGDDTSSLNDVPMRVCRECQGLPIAIVTVGRALRNKNLDEWNVAADQLKMSKPGDIEGVHKNVYKCLKWSYDYLHTKEAKFCFLFCCLFPEDYAIDVEDLCRCLVGLGLFPNANTIENARREVRTTFNKLKDAGLLLKHDGVQFVRMHDIFRDVALQIASKKKRGFMIRAGLGLTKWPEQESFDHFTAISLMANELCELPAGLKCLNLETLLIGGNKACINVPDSFFEEMKGLRVLDLSHNRSSYGKTNRTHQRPKLQGTLSLPSSLQLLTNLRTLYLCDQVLGDFSALAKLKRLEVLSCHHCEIHELPNEIVELNNLRLLDLTDCYALGRIPANVISRLSKLEELYIGGESFRWWEVESTSRERSNASLSELISLPHLKILAVVVQDVVHIPVDFHFRNLTRYNIGIGNESGKHPYSNSLQLESIHSRLPIAIKELLPTTEHLSFSFLEEAYENVIPDIDYEGMEKLKYLELRCCDDLKCLIDSTHWSHLIGFPNLVELNLNGMDNMRVICRGKLPVGSFQKLRIFVATKCRNLRRIFAVLMSPCLEKVEIGHCNELEEVFPHDKEINFEEHALLNSTLKELSFSYLPGLQVIWKEPAQHLKFHNLEVLKVRDCKGLRNLFPLSVAQTLLQLKILEIRMCDGLEKVIAVEDYKVKGSSIIHSQPVSFPKLEALTIEGCNKLKSLFSITIAQSLQKLKELKVVGALKLEELFSEEVEAKFISEDFVEDEKAILLPGLSYLELRKLPSLISFCSGNYRFEWPCLEELRVEDLQGMTVGAAVKLFYITLSNVKNLQVINVRGCSKLPTVFSANSMKTLLALKKVTIEECDSMQEIFQLDGTIIEKDHMLLLSKLISLNLRFLPELRCIWNVPTQFLKLCDLREVRVHCCNRLKYLFSPPLAKTMQQLQSLIVRDCADLEHIIAEDDNEESILFPKLKFLSVTECNKLKSLFPIDIAQGLQQLVSLEVSKSSQLKVLFSQEKVQDSGYGKPILLPCLRAMLLQDLPNLVGLSSGSSHFEFQSMQDFKMNRCDEMKTRFVRDGSNRMHATGKLH